MISVSPLVRRLRQFDWRAYPVALYVAVAGKTLAVVLWLFTTHRGVAAWSFFAPDVFVLHALFAPSGQGLVRVHTQFATSRPEVWLTIDDGPDEQDTPRILELLDRHQARATFFVIGENAARLPHLVRAIRARGHDIGHHTHRHPAGSFWCASPSRLARELDATLETLGALDTRPAWFRAPVGIKHLLLAHALARRQLRYVGWSIRSGDSWAASPEAVVARVIPQLRPGAIILMHEGPSVPATSRVAAVGLLLDELTRRGLTCVIPHPDQLR